jgi:hypothetical protein
VLRAGFTDVLSTGIEIRWIKVRHDGVGHREDGQPERERYAHKSNS